MSVYDWYRGWRFVRYPYTAEDLARMAQTAPAWASDGLSAQERCSCEFTDPPTNDQIDPNCPVHGDGLSAQVHKRKDLKTVAESTKRERQKAARKRAASCHHQNRVQLILDGLPVEYCLNCTLVLKRSAPTD